MTYEDVLKDVEEECENVCIYKECSDCEAYFIKTALKNEDKYRWHDLRKDPSDLPNEGGCILTQCHIRGKIFFTVCTYKNKVFEDFINPPKLLIKTIFAWKYIEPFEVEE